MTLGKFNLKPDAIPVALMNGKQFVELLAVYSLGVTRRSQDIFELGEILLDKD